MKKIYQKSSLQKYRKNKNFRKLKRESFAAGIRNHNYNSKTYKFNQYFHEIRNRRAIFLKSFYKPVNRSKKSREEIIQGKLGIEQSLSEFLDISQRIISDESSKLELDLTDIKRVWPSGITMLCSLMQWRTLKSHNRNLASISSAHPIDPSVRAYLAHSGFYDYVGRSKDINCPISFDESHIVKIQRETDKSMINTRENEIINLLRSYSSLSEDNLEEFVDNILIEAFNNVTEHGVSYRDFGWWTISQYHPTSQFISICIADNGIGVKHSLLTGPQSSAIKTQLKYSDNDKEYLDLSLSNNVSGAIKANDIKFSFFGQMKSSKGARRGQGLKIIVDRCKKLDIKFTLLSRRGYLQVENNKSVTGSRGSDVFAGTMYHFLIPAKGMI